MKRLITASDRYTPKGGYLYIFKHGIGPGTIPSDVSVVKTKDLPNYYTAVWLDRFLTADELKKYDIPSETEINRYLDRIGYCQKNGDVVPCDDINACDKVTSSNRYMANMVSADTDIDEDFDPEYDCKYQAYSYYGTDYHGLEDDFCTNDPSTLIDWVWEHAANGSYIEVCGPKGCARLDPDDLAERVEFGNIGEYEIISQIDYV